MSECIWDDEGTPIIVRDFLRYLKVNLDRADSTISEYFVDLRTFFRYMLVERAAVQFDEGHFNEIPIAQVDLDFIKGITKLDIVNYISYLRSDRVYNEGHTSQRQGLAATSTHRKFASLKTFFNYLCDRVDLLDKNPTLGVDAPAIPHTLPSYLTEDEAFRLLNAVDGDNDRRDYCIILLFLSCALRVSEIVTLDVTDLRSNAGSNFLTITGKGRKQRQVFLEDACLDSLNDYLAIRKKKYAPKSGHEQALFLSRVHQRMSVVAVQNVVKKTLLKAGLDPTKYSAHKLRHTAATLMLQNGVDIRTLQEMLGHENLNTTQIYTHVNDDALRVAARANPMSKAQRHRDSN